MGDDIALGQRGKLGSDTNFAMFLAARSANDYGKYR